MGAIDSRVIRFHQYGEPLDVLKDERVEVPDPGKGTIRVRVLAAGLNPADWELCRGFMAGDLPRGIGYDVAGVVDAIGEDVTDITIGDRVFGTADFTRQPSAGVAEEAILDAWFAIPGGLAPEQAAVLPMVLQTAEWTLGVMHIRPHQTLLVHGAGGMVGFAAVQIALKAGARVIATAGSTFAGELESFGARVTSYGEGMDERVRNIADGPVDHILDTSRPSTGTIAQLVAIAGDPGKIVTISNHDEARAAGARVNLDELVQATEVPTLDFLAGSAAEVAVGRLRVPVASTFPLDDWRSAVELSLSGSPRGKVVVLPEL